MVAGAAAVAVAVAVAVVVAVVVVVVETVARLVQCFLHWNLADVLECAHYSLRGIAKPRSANVDCFSCKRKTSQYPTGPPNGPPTMQRNNVEKNTSSRDHDGEARARGPAGTGARSGCRRARRDLWRHALDAGGSQTDAAP